MSSKKKKINVNTTEESPVIINDIIEIYSVKLSAEDEAIFSNVDIELCKEEALKHEGYKIFNKDNEEISDPWKDKIEAENLEAAKKAARLEEIRLHGMNNIPQRGRRVILLNTPLYKYPNDKKPIAHISGEYFYIDSIISNNRGKIARVMIDTFTEYKKVQELGWIDL